MYDHSIAFLCGFLDYGFYLGIFGSFELKSEKRLGKLDLSQEEKIRMKSTKKRQVMSNFD